MTTLQKIAVALALCAVVAFLAYRSYRDGEPRMFPQGMDLVVRSTVSATVTPGTVMETASSVPSFTPRTPTPTAAVAPLQDPVLAGINGQRASAGVPPLVADAVLRSMAQTHADDMAHRGYFSHTTPDGVTFEVRLRASGYPGGLAAENLGLTSKTPTDVITGWMQSDGHRANLLGAQYAEAGVGSAAGVWQGVPVVFVVAVFGDGK